MDNNIEFKVGNHLGLFNDPECCNCDEEGCCEPVDIETDHYPVFANLSLRTADNVGKYIRGASKGGCSYYMYSPEPGDTPDFDLKFEWSWSFFSGWGLKGDARYDDYFDGGLVEKLDDGVEGRAASFDGSSNFLVYNDMPFYDAQRHFSIEVWVYIDSLSQNPQDIYTIVSKGTEGRINYKLEILGNGNVVLTIRNDSGSTGSCTGEWSQTDGGELLQGIITTHKWHHISASYDGLYGRIIVAREPTPPSVSPIIVNGEKKYLGSNITLCINDDPICIGASNCNSETPSNYFKGYLDDLQIYTNAAR
jgi:hypothetical protein